MHTLKLKVEQAFAAWQEKRRLLEQRSRALETGLSELAAGRSADVEALKAEVDALRRECDQLFANVLSAAKDAKDAGAQ